MEYKLLVDYSAHAFNSKLNELLALDWKIVGGHTAMIIHSPIAPDDEREQFSIMLSHDGQYDLASAFQGIVREYNPEVVVDELIKAMRGRIDDLDKLRSTYLSPGLLDKEQRRLWDFIHKLEPDERD